MSRRQRQTVELTALDAVRLGILPDKDRVSAIAATMLLSQIYWNSENSPLLTLSKLLTDDQVAADTVVADIAVEMERQLRIRSIRITERKRLRKATAMGSKVGRTRRIQRVCQHLFGDPAKWGFIGPICPRVTSPHFNWFKRMPDGVLVAGVEGLVGSEIKTGFVFNITRGGVTRFAKLPSTARSMESLLRFLGLHPRLTGSDSIKIDWMRRAFVIDGTNHLPWVYP